MSTPIYDALKLEQEHFRITLSVPNNGDLEAERLSFKPNGPLIILSNKGPEFGYPIIQAPESTWKTFLRCLGWWKP